MPGWPPAPEAPAGELLADPPGRIAEGVLVVAVVGLDFEGNIDSSLMRFEIHCSTYSI